MRSLCLDDLVRFPVEVFQPGYRGFPPGLIDRLQPHHDGIVFVPLYDGTHDSEAMDDVGHVDLLVGFCLGVVVTNPAS